jgi:DNA-directed RNA polymerase subunit N (RpoN/RPB10)
MILPIRCFTCNRLLADEKLTVFEKYRYLPYATVKEFFCASLDQLAQQNADIFLDERNEVIIHPVELKEQFKYRPLEKQQPDAHSGKRPSDQHFTVSPTTEFLLLNLLGVENYCCRRMFLGYVNMIENIS